MKKRIHNSFVLLCILLAVAFTLIPQPVNARQHHRYDQYGRPILEGPANLGGWGGYHQTQTFSRRETRLYLGAAVRITPKGSMRLYHK